MSSAVFTAVMAADIQAPWRMGQAIERIRFSFAWQIVAVSSQNRGLSTSPALHPCICSYTSYTLEDVGGVGGVNAVVFVALADIVIAIVGPERIPLFGARDSGDKSIGIRP
jgi:hypothetical protein